MREVDERLQRLAQADADVLLCGESGSGKELLARELHLRSARAEGPFVPVSCEAIGPALLESALFGWVRRAPSGAAVVTPGRVALAEGGSLFLEEICALPDPLQARLSRLFEERRYQLPEGGTARADLRVIATSTRDLDAEVSAGRLRGELLAALRGGLVEVPPLRARRGDIRVLFERVWRDKGQSRGISLEVLDVLQQHPWPGNLRELTNLAEQLSVCARGERLEVEDLPPSVRGVELRLEVVSQEILVEEERESERRLQDRTARAQALVPAQHLHSVPALSQLAGGQHELLRDLSPRVQPQERKAALSWGRAASSLPVDLPALVRDLEETFIDAALDEAAGNKALAARLLGLQRTTLAEKLRRRKK